MLFERFAATLRALGPFSDQPHFAIALSGGADSLALTLLAQEYVAQHGGRITTLTVDHRLRAESTGEAQTVAVMMRDRGIEHHILTPAHDDHSNNLQETARTWRYDALRDYCTTHGILHCLLAHNAGDNRETAHHNIERGDTADGASGMSAVRNFRGVRFLRPLLTAERADIEDYLRKHDALWINDPSNSNTKFARVRTRMALKEDLLERAMLDRVIARAGPARAARDTALAQAAITCVMIDPSGFADIDADLLLKLEPTLASQLIADVLTTIGGHTNRPRAADTARVMEAINAANTKRTLHRCIISRLGGHIRIARESAHLDERPAHPHMEGVRNGFAPPKPLAAAPFWCLN